MSDYGGEKKLKSVNIRRRCGQTFAAYFFGPFGIYAVRIKFHFM